MELTSEREIRYKVRNFVNERLRSIALTADESDELSMKVARVMADEEIFRFIIPKEYGGYDLNIVNLCIIREELSKVCIQADYTFATQALGSIPIIKYGTKEQKRKYLPPLARGEKLASFSTTEPGAGSDLGGISTVATMEDEHYVLNGVKCFATNGAVAEPCIVFARTAEHRTRGISAFIMNIKDSPLGLEVKGMELFGPHACAELIFKNCRVPRENLLGQLGQGMSIALNTLNACRATVAAAALGMAQAAFDMAWDYSYKRTVFGQPLSGFQITQSKLADMAAQLEACRLLTYKAAQLGDEGSPESIKYASIAKYFVTEAAFHIIDQSLQIHGGIGTLRKSHIGRLFRALRELLIYEGTSEVQQITIFRQIERERVKGGEK